MTKEVRIYNGEEPVSSISAVHAELILNKFVSSSPVNLCQFAFQIQSGTLRGLKKTFLPYRIKTLKNILMDILG